MELGVQLYGLSSICRNDPEKFFQKLKDMGFRIAEPCLIIGPREDPGAADGSNGSDISEASGFWHPGEAPAFMAHLERAGLHMISCHVLIITEQQEIITDTLKMLNKQYGIRHFVFGCPSSLTQADYTAYAGMLRGLAGDVRSFGAEILLHNGPAEIRETFDGITAYEWLLNECNDMVYAQPDVGWLLYGGADPLAFLKRNENRIHSLHYKDLKNGYEKLPANCCDTGVGKGCADIKGCFEFAKAKGIPHIIDQDQSDGDFMEDLQYAQNYLFNLDTPACRIPHPLRR